MSVLVLHPEKLSCVPVAGALESVPPLGSVLVVQAASRDPEVHLSVIASVHDQAPCLPIAIPGAGVESITSMLSFVTGPLRPVLVEKLADGGELAAAVRAAVRQRPEPAADDVVAYCRRRLSPSAADLIHSALSDKQYRSLRRRLRRHQVAPPSIWRRRMLVLKALSSGWQRPMSEYTIALALDLDPGRLSRACRACFAMSWPALVEIGTWEAVLEQGLRRDLEQRGG